MPSGRFYDAAHGKLFSSPNIGVTFKPKESILTKTKNVAVLAAAFVGVYAIGPFAAHASQIEHALQRAAIVRAEATPVPGAWKQFAHAGTPQNGQDQNNNDQGDGDDFRIGSMGG